MVLCNPTVGANIISSTFELMCLEEDLLTSTVKTLKYGPRSIKEGIETVLNVPVWHNGMETPLNFHIFEDIDFDVMIGHPVEKFFLDVTTLGKLDITLGRKTFSVPINHIMNTKVEEVPQEDPIGGNGFSTF